MTTTMTNDNVANTNNAHTDTTMTDQPTTAVRVVLADDQVPADHGLYLIPLWRIRRDPKKDPRKHRNKATYERMCASFKKEGIVQPIVVRLVERDENGCDLEVVAGNTRFDGAHDVGLSTIPATTRHISAREATVLAGIENMDRADLSPVEEGFHAASLLSALGNDHEEVMKLLGWSRTKLDARIMITHVTEYVQDALVQGELKIGHVIDLAGVPKENQDKLAARIMQEGWSVTEFREKLAAKKRKLAVASFPTDDCQQCQFNSATIADLFASEPDSGHCSNAACWDAKTKAQLDIIITDAKEDFGTVHLENAITEDGHVVLETTGENGVGKEQKRACTNCEYFGAVISTTYGSEGKRREGLCFNLECHAEKVTAYRNLQKQATQNTNTASMPNEGGAKTTSAAAGASTATEGSTAKDSGAQKKTKAPAPTTPDSLKKGIKREAMTRFKQMGQEAIASHPRIGTAISLLMLQQNVAGREFPEWVQDEAKACLESLKTAAKQCPPINEGCQENLATLLARLPADDLNAAMATLGSLTVWRLDPTEMFEKHTPIKSAMLYTVTMNIDRKKYPAMNEAYMKAQTKTGLVEDCRDAGFAEAYDAAHGEKAFATLAKGKAGDLIAAVQSFENFDWSSYEPLGFAPEFYTAK